MESPQKPSYREFMRARRPELYSDTLAVEVTEMDRRQFEFHLHSLTTRKEETAFENFARALAEKELCPNLLPQTGPTGGGDSKVDTETYPVATSIATLWYEGDPSRSAGERWGFAISAKAKWKPKAESDVAKIAATGRGYALVYFITNQPVRDKDRAETEENLTKKYGIQVRILDRTWIIERVVGHKRWQLVADTLQFEFQRSVKTKPGPLDTERSDELEAVDAKIEAAAGKITLQIVEESLRSALLARGLDKPRTEVDGRFDRAERLAREVSNNSQLHRIWYQRAWTAVWWFDDVREALRLYDLLAAEVLSSEMIWDIEELVNLWLTFQVSHPQDGERTVALRAALQRHADDHSKKTSSLWGHTQLLLMDMIKGVKGGQSLDPTLHALREVLGEVRHKIEFPAEPIVRIVRELSSVLGDSPAYDQLLDSVIELEQERHGERAAGEMRLERGLQKLERKKPYEAIDDLAKAQFLLAQEERRGAFIAALAGTGLAYESAGLLYAARANLVSALDRCMYSYYKEGAIDDRALPLLRKLTWIELQLGRIPYALAWIKLMPVMGVALSLNAEQAAAVAEEIQGIDRTLGILILKTPHDEWAQLTRLPDVLNFLNLEMSRAATLFILGHEDRVRDEYGTKDDDLQTFFSSWVNSAAAEDLPDRPSWHIGPAVMTTVVLGCRLHVTARGGLTSALLGESIISFLEAFYSTALQSRDLISPRAELMIEVRQSERAAMPFSVRTVEDECGEVMLVVTHPVIPAASLVGEGFEDAIMNLFAHVTVQLQMDVSRNRLREYFSKYRAQDRAYHVAQSSVSVTNVLGDSPQGRAEDWVGAPGLTVYPQTRQTSWKPTASEQPARTAPAPTLVEGDPPANIFGADALKHRDMGVMSPINLPVWDKARWKGLGVAGIPGSNAPAGMILAFTDVEAGRKIFRGWRKKTGEVDEEGWIGATVITGTQRDRPLDYRVAIGIGEAYMLRQLSGNKRMLTMVFRMHDITPTSSHNLDVLRALYQRSGRVVLLPGKFNAALPGMSLDDVDADLGIELRQLTVIPAWKIGPDSPLSGAMEGIENPVLPPDVTDPPFARMMQRRSEMQRRRAE